MRTFALVVLLALAGCGVRDDGKTYLIDCAGMKPFYLKRDGVDLRDEDGNRVRVPDTCKLTIIEKPKGE